MPAPVLEDVLQYLQDPSWGYDDLQHVLDAEKDAQASRCRVPGDDEDWPRALSEALMRRVATNLANRNLPLGVSSSVSELGGTAMRVGGLDREVRRLEAPYRRVVVG